MLAPGYVIDASEAKEADLAGLQRVALRERRYNPKKDIEPDINTRRIPGIRPQEAMLCGSAVKPDGQYPYDKGWFPAASSPSIPVPRMVLHTVGSHRREEHE